MTGASPWPDPVDEIVAGDHVVALAYVTPARGVVIVPLSNFGLRDRAAGTISVNSSVGAWKKLERIRRNPQVALAFHTREHGFTNRPEFVLVQGRATVSEPIPDYPSTVLEHWERFEDWGEFGQLWKRWLRVYALRVEIEVAVERLLVWPDLACRGTPRLLGEPLVADAPKPQRPPARGREPRVDHRRAARRARRLPHLLLGWVGADGFPFVVPVDVQTTTRAGILLGPPPATVPAAGRRAGLTAHSFSLHVVGQHQRVHTGWMEADLGAAIVYAPHTTATYRFPASPIVFRLVAGAATRWRLRQARRAGVLDRDGRPAATASAEDR